MGPHLGRELLDPECRHAPIKQGRLNFLDATQPPQRVDDTINKERLHWP